MQGDIHHWVDLFNQFDSFFEKYVKSRKDLLIDDNFLDLDRPFPREAILQILRVIRIILENCSNKHFSSFEVCSLFDNKLRSMLFLVLLCPSSYCLVFLETAAASFGIACFY